MMDAFKKVRISDEVLSEWLGEGLSDPYGNHVDVDISVEDAEGFVELTFTRRQPVESANVEKWDPRTEAPPKTR